MASDRKKRAKKKAAAAKARGKRMVEKITADEAKFWGGDAGAALTAQMDKIGAEEILSDEGETWESQDAWEEQSKRMTAMARAGDSAAKIAKAMGLPVAHVRHYVTAEKRRLRLIERRAPYPLRKAAVEAFKAILAHEKIPVERAEMQEDDSTFDVEITMDPKGVYDVDAMVDEAAKESGLRDYYDIGGSGAGFGLRDITFLARSKPRKRGAKGWTGNPPRPSRKAGGKKPAKKDRRKLLSRLLRGT